MQTIKFEIAQLRHLYKLMLNDEVEDMQKAARGLLSPVIEKLECLEETDEEVI